MAYALQQGLRSGDALTGTAGWEFTEIAAHESKRLMSHAASVMLAKVQLDDLRRCAALHPEEQVSNDDYAVVEAGGEFFLNRRSGFDGVTILHLRIVEKQAA